MKGTTPFDVMALAAVALVVAASWVYLVWCIFTAPNEPIHGEESDQKSGTGEAQGTGKEGRQGTGT